MTDPAALTDEELAEIGARADKSTAGPWQPYFSVHGDPYVGEARRGSFGMVVSVSPDDYGRADCEFIAHARTDVPRLIAALRASRAVADDLAIALHHCSNFLPLFLSEHGEEGRKLRRALAVDEQVQTAMKAYCDLTDTHRPDLTTRTVTPKDVHD